MIDKIVRGLLTLGVVGTCVYMLLVEMAIPEWLYVLAGGFVGQYAPRPGGRR